MNLKLKKLITATMMAAVMCVLSALSIYIGAVPVTLSIVAVLISATLLEPFYAVFSVSIYLMIGAIGVPVFANFTGGIAAFVGLTGGFIMSYPLVAFAVSKIIRAIKRVSVPALCLGYVAGLALCYLCGTLWYMLVARVDIISALIACVAPFIVLDLVKVAACIAIAKSLFKTGQLSFN